MSSSVVLSHPQSTPVKTASKPVVADSPGNWKHPRLAEIARRQRKTEFSENNAKAIAYNGGALIASIVLRQLVTSKVPPGLFNAEIKYWAAWIYLILQLFPTSGIIIAFLPLFRSKDDLADIPLTPAQRKLLGLPPSSAPPTPSSAISTPPRYSRTPSLAGSPTSNKSYNSSPLSGNGSPASDRRLSGSPFSPSTTSPLFQKAVTGGLGGRKLSFGSPSQLGASTATSLFGGEAPGTPSPMAAGKRSSVGLNSKWLYERGRRSSGNSFLY